MQSNKKIDDKNIICLIDSISELKRLSNIKLDLNNTSIGDKTVIQNTIIILGTVYLQKTLTQDIQIFWFGIKCQLKSNK
jgi:hypothetical protein